MPTGAGMTPIADHYLRNNQLQNQAQRNLQAAGSTPLSASPAHLSISSGILPPAYNTHNPYHTSPYAAGPSPFAFPQQPSLQHQNPYQQQQLRHDSITQAQQHQIPPSPGLGRKRRESELDPNQLSGASSLGGFSVDQHGLFSPGTKSSHDQSGYSIAGPSQPGGNVGDVMSQNTDMSAPRPAKKGRTNTPWTPAEEQRLKIMRDAGNSWSEIAKTFPTRTEGSVKKHWYKDMHYAEFAEDEVSAFSAALMAAIKDYENSKWKVIGQKVGKPAKACEQYAKEHFGTKS